MLINDAFAQAASSTAQSDAGWVTLLPMIGILVLFYFLLIRPQAKRAKEHKLMVEELQRGDEVITNGGILGQVLNVSEAYIIIEIAPAIEVTILKSSVQTLLPKGTLKSIEPKNKTPKTKTKSAAPENNKAEAVGETTETIITEADNNNEKK